MYLLSQMNPGESAFIFKVNAKGSMRRRLLDIGFIKGSKVDCIMKSPFGDPTAYFIRGTLIALRKEEANQIEIGD